MKAYTDIEQSKKLAKILPPESADMHWQYIEEDDGQLQWFCLPKDFSINQYNTVSAWSLAALINLLPSEITVVEEYLTTQYDIRIRKYKVTDEMDVCQIAYGNYGSSGSWYDMINTGEKESLLDASFEMICWLKKEKYI